MCATSGSPWRFGKHQGTLDCRAFSGTFTHLLLFTGRYAQNLPLKRRLDVSKFLPTYRNLLPYTGCQAEKTGFQRRLGTLSQGQYSSLGNAARRQLSSQKARPRQAFRRTRKTACGFWARTGKGKVSFYQTVLIRKFTPISFQYPTSASSSVAVSGLSASHSPDRDILKTFSFLDNLSGGMSTSI